MVERIRFVQWQGIHIGPDAQATAWVGSRPAFSMHAGYYPGLGDAGDMLNAKRSQVVADFVGRSVLLIAKLWVAMQIATKCPEPIDIQGVAVVVMHK